MALYSYSDHRLIAAANGSTQVFPVFDVKAPATHNTNILEIVYQSVLGAVNYGVGIGRASTETFQLDPRKFISEELDLLSETTFGTVWSATPTVTTFIRRMQIPNTAASGVIWSFPRGLGIPPLGSIVMTMTNNPVTSGGANTSVEIDE